MLYKFEVSIHNFISIMQRENSIKFSQHNRKVCPKICFYNLSNESEKYKKYLKIIITQIVKNLGTLFSFFYYYIDP